jgi:hypothetical protein
VSAAALASRGYIDIQFRPGTNGLGIDSASVLDSGAEFTLKDGAGNDLTLVGAPVLLDAQQNVYRYFFTGWTIGSVTPTYIAKSWTDTAGSFGDSASPTTVDPTFGAPLTNGSLTHGTWFDVTYTPVGDAKVDATTLGSDDLTLTGGGSEGMTYQSVTQVGPNTYRYAYTGDFTSGTVNVAFKDGGWKDTAGNLSDPSSGSFKLIQQAQSFYIELSGGLILDLAGALGEPLMEVKANVTLEIDTNRKVFTLTFSGQLKLIKLGTVGATSGRFVLDMGNGLSSTPQFWGVATLETNFSALEQYGIFMFAKGTLQVNTTSQTKVETLTLPGLGPNGTDAPRTFTLRPQSFSLELVGQLRLRAPGSSTDLVRLQGGFYLTISPEQFQIFATAELSFGVGDAQLTYGSATGLIVIQTGLAPGRNPGVAGYLKVSSGGSIGLPGAGTLFSITGSISVMFNTTKQDQVFQIPPDFLPLLHPGDPTSITIYKAAPGLDGTPRPNAPAGGEVYVSATIAAQMTIGGVLTLNGFIQIQAAVGGGNGRLAITGAVGGTIPFLGSVTGTLNFEAKVGANSGIAGRIHLTVSVNQIPGVQLQGEFLLELNTFATPQTIQTFKIKKDANGAFNGFERDAAGNLVVGSETLSVVGRWSSSRSSSPAPTRVSSWSSTAR